MIETKANKSFTSNVWLAVLFLTILSILCGSWLVTRSVHYTSHSRLLSFFLTIDIGLLIPLSYYLIASRKLKAPAVGTLVIFIASLGLATLILPSEDQYYLDKLKYLLIVSELIILIYGIIKIRAIIKTYTEFALQRNDFVWSLTQTFQKLFGTGIAISIIQSEIQTLRYSLFFWKAKDEITVGDTTFSGYKNNSYKVVMGVIGFVMLIELFSVHLLLWRFGMTVVVIAFILSIYGILFLLGDFMAIIRRPLTITRENIFYLRVGLRWNATIEIGNIDQIIKETLKTDKVKKGALNCVLVGEPDCILILKEPVVVTGYYGIKKTTNKILLNVDEPDAFISEILSRKVQGS